MQEGVVTFRRLNVHIVFCFVFCKRPTLKTQIKPDFVRNGLGKYIILNFSANLEGWQLLLEVYSVFSLRW